MGVKSAHFSACACNIVGCCVSVDDGWVQHAVCTVDSSDNRVVMFLLVAIVAHIIPKSLVFEH